MSGPDLVSLIRSSLSAAADPARAAAAQRYLKSDMPMLGVRAPEVRRIVRDAVAASPPAALEELKAVVLALWREARWREERYAAIDLTGWRPAAGELAMLPVYEEIIRSGAWWDLVDGVAHRLRQLLRAHPTEMAAVLRRWSTDRDFWIRRASITAQLGAKNATDRDLLGDVIEANLAESEFFIRKAIGWALRDFSATDPDWVRSFVQQHPKLSPLSRKEALRKLR
ncbi:DNA alkylation repair protein [Arthrobacter sp. B3I4]|uniref:DNA alkylation repair protein n=1 Tax=Arthrobacter sp. B3I4 TaxID=3042267 RepID=UPI00277EB998|nr:DNA alkylation repair protein [Arthrobacter sp. B3I4]MDQ0756143.1 3-methyladenine DNA glycosylase AlkD [Arthrobacter sp. B3I4]